MDRSKHTASSDWKFSLAVAFFCILSICLGRSDDNTGTTEAEPSHITAMNDRGLHYPIFSLSKI